MYTFAGETILDPFLGSGTTALAAMETGRRSIGVELNVEFLPLIRERLGLDGRPGDSKQPPEKSVVIDPLC